MSDSNQPTDSFIQRNEPEQGTQCTNCKNVCSVKRIIFIIITVVIALVVVIVIPSVTTTNSASPQDPITGPEDLCLFYDTYEVNKSNPLGDKCTIGSKFVTEECPEIGAKDKCKKCIGDKWLPNLCFCDRGDQCNGKDRLRKMDCSTCALNSFCPCQHGGNCSCGNQPTSTALKLKCICPNGFGGDYCEFVPIRICNKTAELVRQLNHCPGSTDEECYITQNSNWTCSVLRDKPKAGLPNCTLN